VKNMRNYSILCIACVVAVILKFIVYYSLIQLTSGFLFVVLTSCILTALIFGLFKNKWIPAAFFAAFSILLFADVTYYSFFSKYLSVGMLGAAEVVGDIGESIKEVMRPVNFLTLADAALICGTLAFKQKTSTQFSFDVVKNYVIERFNFKKNDEKNNRFIDRIDGLANRISSLVNRIKESINQLVNLINNEKAQRYLNVAKSKCKDFNDKLTEGKKRAFCGILIVVIIAGVIVGSNFSRFATQIKNQEMYTYHVSDIISAIFPSDTGSLKAFENSYLMEKSGEYFGIAEGKNLVFIQLESFMDFVIGREYNDQEITPFINELIKNDSTYFDNFYQQVGSGNTSDAEFAANNSIYGSVLSYTNKVYGETNYFRGLPVLLGEKGYDTAVFHAYEDRTFWNRDNAYPQLGFNEYFGGLIGRDGDYLMTEWMGWGLTDSEFFLQTVPLMQENLKAPYYAFVNTLSNHHPFKMLDHYKFIELLPEDEETLAGNYIQSAAYLDYSLEIFFEELKKEGMYENSIFVMYGDHAGLTHTEETDEVMGRILGRTYDYDTLLNVPLIIHIPGAEDSFTQTISTAGGHLDIMPTVAYLMGFEELDTIYFGHNLYNVKSNIVPEQTFIKRGSFVFDDIMYEMALDGVFENGRAWNVNTGEEVSLDGLKPYYLKSMEIIQASEYLLETDALRSIYLDGGNLAEIGSKDTKREYPEELVIAGYPESDLLGENSIEALNNSYENGYRYIRLTLNWSEDGEEGYTLNKAGEKEANHEDLIKWSAEHEDAYIVIDIDGDYVHSLDNTLTFFGLQGEEGAAVGKRIILVAENTKDFTGRHDLFLDVSACETDNESIRNFIDVNNVWAIIIAEEDVKEYLAAYEGANCQIYVEQADGKIIKLVPTKAD